MDNWKDLMEGRTFITDLGTAQKTEVDGVPQTLERYAVWSPIQGGTGHTVVEVGSDLENLMGRYGVPTERVCVLAAE